VRLALKRPHQYEAGMHKEHEDAYDSKPRNIPAPDPTQAHGEQNVFNDDQQDGDTSQQIQVGLRIHSATIAVRFPGPFLESPDHDADARFSTSDMNSARLVIRVEVIAVSEQQPEIANQLSNPPRRQFAGNPLLK
jgi:hypothetical protein